MKHKILLSMALIQALISCKTTAPEANQTELSGGSVDTLCLGDRKLLASGRNGFAFDAAEWSLGNAYWSGVTSTLAYFSNDVVEPEMHKLGATSFTGYGSKNGKDTGTTQGFWTDFPNGSLLTFRGTADFYDLITDVKFWSFKGKAYNREAKPEILKIHKGFWDGLEEVWASILKNHILSLPLANYSVDSPEAFRIVNATFRGIMQESSVEDYNPNQVFTPELNKLIELGLIKKDANMDELLGVLNVWAEVALRVADAYKASVKSGDLSKYKEAVEAGLIRKKKNFARVHPYFNYRQFKPIWITGHSLGAALATLATYRFMKIGVPIKGLITFGSPAVGNDIFEYFITNSAIEDGVIFNFARFQNDNDVVTRSPPNVPFKISWRHIGSPAFLDDKKVLNIRLPVGTDAERVKKGLAGYTGSNSISYYTTENPSHMKGIATLAIERSVSDHLMTDHYLSLLEQITFGKKAAGCP